MQSRKLMFYSFLIFASIVYTYTLFWTDESSYQFVNLKELEFQEELSPQLKTNPHYNFTNTTMKIKQDLDWYLKQMIKYGTAISQLVDSDLTPGPLTNALFSGLVGIVREFPSFNVTPIFGHPSIKRLQPIVTEKCSKAEYLLEADFAKQILNGAKLRDFMYYTNYELLIEFEVRSLEKYMFPGKIENISQVAIIGSGPLPLTSIVLIDHLRKSAKITNYDHNEEANLLGEEVVKSVQGEFGRISFVSCSALDLNLGSQVAHADLVYLAALVGNNSEEKQAIISHLHKIMKPGSILIARSATGLRKFIYHPIGKEEFQEFEQFRQFDPDNKVIINSIVVGKKLV